MRQMITAVASLFIVVWLSTIAAQLRRIANTQDLLLCIRAAEAGVKAKACSHLISETR